MIDTVWVLILSALIMSILIPFIQRWRNRAKKPMQLEEKLPKHRPESTKLSKPIIEKFFLSTNVASTTPSEGKHLTRSRMFYTSNTDKMSLFASFVWEGLYGGDRVVYVFPEGEGDPITSKLKEYGIDVGKHKEEGSLTLVTLQEVFLTHEGSFDRNKSLNFWKELRKETIKRGYRHERHLVDLGDLGFIKGQEERYFSYLREEARMQLMDPFLIELRAVNRENLTDRHINEFRLYTDRFMDLFQLANVFSKALGQNHSEMAGRKILFEFDPASRYEKIIQDFATEASANVELLVVLTRRDSTIHSLLNEQKAAEFFCLTQQVSAPKELSENETLLPATDTSLTLDAMDKTIKAHPNDNISVIFDSLSDLVLSIGFDKTYQFAKYVSEILASRRVTALFLLNEAAHDAEVVHSLRSLFSNQIAFGKSGMQAVKLPKIETQEVETEKVLAKK